MTDPYGYVAHRPVGEQNLPGGTRRYGATAGGVERICTHATQAEMLRCLSCTAPAGECKGTCRGEKRAYRRKGAKAACREKPPEVREAAVPVARAAKDPCLGCYSRGVCGAYGGTCNEKERWEGRR